MSSNGFLYCIYSLDTKPNKYFEKEFLLSYKSLKKVLPNSNVTLYTNIKFNNIYEINNIIYDKNINTTVICKAIGLLKSPYNRTILLDTDTIIHRNIINDIFIVLDEFSFTCCHANQNNKGSIYPDLNTGLLGVKNNDFTRKLIQQWINLYGNSKEHNDQKYFRKIFMENKKEFYILPTYFMYRSYHYIDYPEQAVMTHDHSMSKKEVTKKIIKKYNQCS